MNQAKPDGPSGTSPETAESQRMAELMDLMRAHEEATERLRRTHDALQAEVTRLTAELARKNRLAVLGEMSAAMAHEIRNPLGGIQLYASLLERRLAERPRDLEMVRQIISGVSFLDTTVNDMLAFARLPEPDRQVADLANLLKATLQLAAAQLEENRVEAHVNCHRPMPVSVDADMVGRAVLNLLINAADSMPDGGRLDVSADWADPQRQGVVIEVRDTGAGLDEAQVGRLFEPFFTTKKHGTGLGLAIANRIAEAHGGRIVATNRPAGGARFRLTLSVAGEPRQKRGQVAEKGDGLLFRVA